MSANVAGIRSLPEDYHRFATFTITTATCTRHIEGWVQR